MKQYSTREPRLQAVKNDKDKQKTINLYCDLDTGEAVEALQDEKYPWRQKKQKTIAVADLYRAGHDDKYADRAMSCSTWLQYLANLAR